MKQKTASEKKRAGTYQPCRDKKQVQPSDPLKAIPVPMYQLTETENQYFQQAAQLMINNQTLTASDVPALTRAASTWGVYQQARHDIGTFGAVQTTPSGYSTKSAYWQIMSESEKALTTFENSAGFSLVSRSKLPPPPRIEYYTEIDELINPKHKAGTPRRDPFDEI